MKRLISFFLRKFCILFIKTHCNITQIRVDVYQFLPFSIFFNKYNIVYFEKHSLTYITITYKYNVYQCYIRLLLYCLLLLLQEITLSIILLFFVLTVIILCENRNIMLLIRDNLVYSMSYLEIIYVLEILGIS